MTRQRYSIKESLNRILLLFQNKAVSTDSPDSVPGESLSHDQALSDLAELLAGSLPGESAVLPSAIVVNPAGHIHNQYVTTYWDDSVYKGTGTAVNFATNLSVVVSGTSVHISAASSPQFTTEIIGTSPNYAYFASDGTFRLTGSATSYEDLRVDGLNTRPGVVAPTDETGFRGNSGFQVRNFVHNQADEVQFDIQMPHGWNEGSPIYPHVHFSPWITGTATVQAAQFILEYYWANAYSQFPTGSSTYTMTYTWTGSFQWHHFLALNATPLSATGKTMSSILKCRLYRDNSVGNNLGGKVTFLYFDIHFEVDGMGSAQEYIK